MKTETTNAPKAAPLPPRFMVRAVLALRRWLISVADAIVPPQLPLFEHATGMIRTQLLGNAARLRIADHLADGPLEPAALAARIGCDPDALHRTMRALVSIGVFTLGKDGKFANNRMSEWLCAARPGTSRDFAEYFASASNASAWADLGRTLATGKNAFERVHGLSVWDYFDQHPDERAVFAAAMGSNTFLDAPSVAQAYPFGEVERVCDVGGSRGVLLAEVLAKHRHLKGVLFDAAGVIATAGPVLDSRGVGDRVELSSGSFFETVPPGCDAYMLKNILHDWDDARAAAILQNCRRAMQPGSRVLALEIVVERDTVGPVGPLSDIQMMIACSEGRERGRADYERLFERTGFKLRRVVPTASLTSIIEGVAV